MNEKTLLIISFICIAIGLPVLYLLSALDYNKEPRILSEITGEVKSIYQSDKVTIVNVKPEGTVPIVSFDKENRVEKGQNITAKGRLSEYKNKLEFIAEDIRIG